MVMMEPQRPVCLVDVYSWPPPPPSIITARTTLLLISHTQSQPPEPSTDSQTDWPILAKPSQSIQLIAWG